MDITLMLVIALLLIIDIIQGAMLTALHQQIDITARTCTFLLHKFGAKSGDFESKFEQKDK